MNEWFFAKNGQQNGPVSHDELRQLAQTGGLDAKDLVWNSTMKDWVPAGQVETLFGAPATASAPAADPANPYAPPQSSPTDPAQEGTSLSEIIPGSEPIDVMACVKRGFELTTRNFGNILLVGVVYIGIMIAATVILGVIDSALGLGQTTTTQGQWNAEDPGASMSAFSQTTTTGSPLNAIVSNVLSIFLTLGLVRIGLNLASGREFSVGMLFGGGRHLLRAIGASILYGLMVALGLVLLIVPGIYLALRYGQFMAAIVDRDMGVMESLSYSSSITTNNRMNLFLLTLLGIAIAIAGIIALCVGIFFAYPVIWLSWMVAFRWMQYGHRAAMDQPGTQTPMLANR